MNTTLWQIADDMFSTWDFGGSMYQAFRDSCADHGVKLTPAEESQVWESVFEMIHNARTEAGVEL